MLLFFLFCLSMMFVFPNAVHTKPIKKCYSWGRTMPCKLWPMRRRCLALQCPTSLLIALPRHPEKGCSSSAYKANWRCTNLIFSSLVLFIYSRYMDYVLLSQTIAATLVFQSIMQIRSSEKFLSAFACLGSNPRHASSGQKFGDDA